MSGDASQPRNLIAVLSYADAASVAAAKDPRCFCLPLSHMCASYLPVRLYRVTPRNLPRARVGSTPAILVLRSSAACSPSASPFESFASPSSPSFPRAASRQNSRCCSRDSRSRPRTPRLPMRASSSTSGWMRTGARRRRLRSGSSGRRDATGGEGRRGGVASRVRCSVRSSLDRFLSGFPDEGTIGSSVRGRAGLGAPGGRRGVPVARSPPPPPPPPPRGKSFFAFALTRGARVSCGGAGARTRARPAAGPPPRLRISSAASRGDSSAGSRDMARAWRGAGVGAPRVQGSPHGRGRAEIRLGTIEGTNSVRACHLAYGCPGVHEV